MQTDEEVEAGIAEANFLCAGVASVLGRVDAHPGAPLGSRLRLPPLWQVCAVIQLSWRPRWLPAVCRPLQTILWLRDIARLENPAGGAF